MQKYVLNVGRTDEDGQAPGTTPADATPDADVRVTGTLADVLAHGKVALASLKLADSGDSGEYRLQIGKAGSASTMQGDREMVADVLAASLKRLRSVGA